MAASECSEEATTQHHLGAAHGYGPVDSAEQVIFAVFESTERDGNRIKANVFQTKQLTRHEFSLGRSKFITKAEFESVIAPLLPKQGPLVGIARAQVAEIRALQCDVNGGTKRAACVTDRVTPLDY